MRRVVSIWLPTWPTDRLRRTDPAAPLRDKPFVTARRDGASQVLASVDAAARAAGLRPGMSIAQANAFVPGLVAAEAEPEVDAAALRDRLAAWAARVWSPIVSPDPPDGLVLDATGSAHLFGGEDAMLARIVAGLGRAGVTARAAIADTPGAAHAVARFGKADPIAVVPSDGVAAALAPLPIAALRIAPETAAELYLFGFRRIGQLYGARTAPITRRFGPEPMRRRDQALGTEFEAITPFIPVQAPRRRRVFAEPLGSPESLARAAERLVADLCVDLEAGGQGVRRLDLLFERVDRRTGTLRVGLGRPSRDPRHLARLLTDRIGEVDPGFGVEAMVLIASRTEPLGPRQRVVRDLGDGAEAAADLAELIDRLGNLPEVARVYAAAPVETDVPERVVRRVAPLAAPDGASAWPPDLPRPVWLLAPEPVQAVSLMPDDPPLRFTWRGRPHRVRRADGPERIFLEWWRGPAELRALRDYYRVEDEEGGRFWLFREGRTNAGTRWFLHGVFA